jgi:hypothetical protein
VIGVAVQVHHPDPRTTLDIDVAVLRLADIPGDALCEAGFSPSGAFEHSENWVVAGNVTPVQFTDDPAFAPAIHSGERIRIENVSRRVVRTVDLVRQKIRAGSGPACRRSKRLSDLVDAQGLLEAFPALGEELTLARTA